VSFYPAFALGREGVYFHWETGVQEQSFPTGDPVKQIFAMAAASVLALWVSCKSKQPEDPGGDAPSVSRVRTDSAASDRAEAKAALQARYAKVEKRLDSLWRDTLGMSGRNEKVYQRLLGMARAEQSMDSLETSLFTVDSAAGSASHRDGSR
jgi:hypothetical protein